MRVLVLVLLVLVGAGCSALQSASSAAYSVIPPGKYSVGFSYGDGAGKTYTGELGYEKDVAQSAAAGHDVLVPSFGPSAFPSIHLAPVAS